MSGKGAIARKKAIKLDVEAWVNYAVYSDDHTNPYPEDDKRYGMFASSMQRKNAFAADFEEMCKVYGDDVSRYQKRHYDRPALLAIDELPLTPQHDDLDEGN